MGGCVRRLQGVGQMIDDGEGVEQILAACEGGLWDGHDHYHGDDGVDLVGGIWRTRMVGNNNEIRLFLNNVFNVIYMFLLFM